MKSYKSILVILLLSTSMVVEAQTTLREAFKAFIEACPSAMNRTPETMGTALKQMNAGVITNYDPEKSDQLVEKYLNEKFYDQMTEAMLPYLEKNITVDDLKYLTEQMLTPAGKVFQEHQTILNAKANQFEKMGQDAAMKVVAGETPTPIQPVECPESYKQLFDQYYAESKLTDAMKPFFDSMAGTLLNESQKAVMEKMKNYFTDNLPICYLNASYGIMTEDDLRFGTQLYKTDAWKNEMKAMKGAMSHAQELGMSVVMGYLGWLKTQGVETTM